MKYPDVVCKHIFPNPKLPIVKKVDRHEICWVCTEFCVVCVLVRVSESMATAGRMGYPRWNQRPVFQYLQLSTDTHTLIKDDLSRILHTGHIP